MQSKKLISRDHTPPSDEFVHWYGENIGLSHIRSVHPIEVDPDGNVEKTFELHTPLRIFYNLSRNF